MRPLHEILTAELTRQGLPVAELARRAAVTLSVCQEVLSGKTRDPRIGTVVALVEALGHSLAWYERERKATPEART